MTRKFTLTIPPDQAKELKILAQKSKMTVEQYCQAVLNESIASGEFFEILKKKKKV